MGDEQNAASVTAHATGGDVVGDEGAGASGRGCPGRYVPDREPLRPRAFRRLPPGAVVPAGWLADQLAYELDGLSGRLDEVSRYLAFEGNGWVAPENDAWEELPYWLRGLIDLGYVTGDERTIARAHGWIEAVLRTQADDGFFGPRRLRTAEGGVPDHWPQMPMLRAMRSYAEYNGARATGDDRGSTGDSARDSTRDSTGDSAGDSAADSRVLDFLSRYCRFLHAQPTETFGRGWGAYRIGDLLDTVTWLYNRTGDGWLLDLAHAVHAGGADFTRELPTRHNVNIAQGFREPAQYAMLTGDPSLTRASYRAYERVMARYGRFPGGGFAGDENCRPGHVDPRQGFETCGIVEFMHSFELLTGLTGDPVWADRCEELAFNLLPAASDPRHHTVRYLVPANGVLLDRTQHTRGQFENHFPMQAFLPGAHNTPTAYRCCTHNHGIGWPYFVQELWLATPDRGVCASMYAPSRVGVRVGDEGRHVTITAETAYPFEEDVRLTVRTDTAGAAVRFPLWLRIPAWCARPELRVNGRAVPVRAIRPGYLRVEREWADDDKVTLTLPMDTAVRTWPDNHDAVSVRRGPLHYSLAIEEQWRTAQGEEAWPWFEVRPGSAWNYGLDLPEADPESRLRVRPRSATPAESSGGPNPFTPEGVPLQIHAPARRIAAWTLDPDGVVRPLQPCPVATDAPSETVRLIPSGAARSRITMFPRVSSDPGARHWDPALVTASHCWPWESVGGRWGPDGHGRSGVDAVADHQPPARSSDESVPRLEWTGREGTREWIAYDFTEPRVVGSFGVYWYEGGRCRVPASWRLLYSRGDEWAEVGHPSGYGVGADRYNIVRFDPVTTTALRLEVVLAEGASGGILHCLVDPARDPGS